MAHDLDITITLPASEWHTITEALDSHLYWQVNEDHSRRDSGYIQEPYTEEEQEIVDLQSKVEALVRAGEELTDEQRLDGYEPTL